MVRQRNCWVSSVIEETVIAKPAFTSRSFPVAVWRLAEATGVWKAASRQHVTSSECLEENYVDLLAWARSYGEAQPERLHRQTRFGCCLHSLPLEPCERLGGSEFARLVFEYLELQPLGSICPVLVVEPKKAYAVATRSAAGTNTPRIGSESIRGNPRAYGANVEKVLLSTLGAWVCAVEVRAPAE